MPQYIIEWTVQVVVEAEDHEAAERKVSEWTIADAIEHDATVSEPSAARETIDP